MIDPINALIALGTLTYLAVRRWIIKPKPHIKKGGSQ